MTYKALRVKEGKEDVQRGRSFSTFFLKLNQKGSARRERKRWLRMDRLKKNGWERKRKGWGVENLQWTVQVFRDSKGGSECLKTGICSAPLSAKIRGREKEEPSEEREI